MSAEVDFLQFSSDLPRTSLHTFFSPGENEESMKRMGVAQVVRQLNRGEFRGSVAHAEISGAELISDRFNVSMSTSLETPADTLTVLIPQTLTGDITVCGEALGKKRLVVIPGCTQIDLVNRGMIGTDSIVIAKSRYLELSEALCPEFEPVKHLQISDGAGPLLEDLRSKIVNLVQCGGTGMEGGGESGLLHFVVMWLYSSGIRGKDSGFSSNPEYRRIAKLSREYIEANYQQDLPLDMLCTATGVGARNLQRSFQKYFGVSPLAYLKTVRLEAARRKLASRDVNAGSVTSIATECGFSHLGRFSRDFSHRFGQLPSELVPKNAS